MPKAKEVKPTQEEQSARFIEAAKRLEADESGRSFVRALKVIAPKKPKRKG